MDELIPDALDGERLDRVVSLLADVSRSTAAGSVASGAVSLDGRPSARSTRVRSGQRIWIDDSIGDAPAPLTGDPDVDLSLIHVDDDVVLVDKLPGQIVHPGAGHDTGTIVQGLIATFPEIVELGEPERPGIVHRLDKGTSGVFVVARSAHAFESLTRQLRHRTVDRTYFALVWGVPTSPTGLIDAPIGRAQRDPTRMTVRDDGKEARTRYAVEATWDDPGAALVSCELETGRTHQIRVHMAAIKHPVVGDGKYGGARDGLALERPALHAALLAFDHPATGERVRYESALPDDLRALVSSLGDPDSGAVPQPTR